MNDHPAIGQFFRTYSAEPVGATPPQPTVPDRSDEATNTIELDH
jgi:hypothetical protein